MKRDNPRERTAFDPPVRVTDDGRRVHISIGLPGVTEEQVRIDLENTTFTLSVSGDGRTLEKAIQVPQAARFYKKKFSGGILEIFLEKPVP